MYQKEKHYRIGLFGHYGNNNLGDEATILSTIQNLRDRIPNIELEGLSMNPFDTQERYNIESFPIRYNRNYFEPKQSEGETSNLNSGRPQSSALRVYIKKLLLRKIEKSSATFGFLYLLGNLRIEIRFLRKVRERLKKMDVLIICGSSQFVDGHGPFSHPYTLFKWLLLAKSTGTRVFFVSVGAGPLSHFLSYWILKKTLTRADYVSYRDNWSKELIQNHIPGLKGLVYPDLAHSLKTIPSNKNFKKKQNTIAINPMPFFDSRYGRRGNLKKYEVYVDHMVNFVNYLLNREFTVNLYNNHPKDLLVIDDLIEQLQKIPDVNVNKVNIIRNKTVQNLIDTISEADVIVATRFHSTVLPLRLGKPVLGICYYWNSKELLEDVGLEDYYVDIYKFTTRELCTKFDSIFDNIDNLKKKIVSHYERYEELLNDQWDRLADLIKD